MTREDVMEYADWVRCGNCDGAPPEALVDLALSVSDFAGEMREFLRLAHCCACQGHCVCGGYVAGGMRSWQRRRSMPTTAPTSPGRSCAPPNPPRVSPALAPQEGDA